MAENVTPVTLEIKDFAPREVIMVDYKFDQATDREGQIAGIPRGGRLQIRVKAMNDGNNELIAWMLFSRTGDTDIDCINNNILLSGKPCKSCRNSC